VKTLVRIVALGVLAFLAVAVLQEWDYFSAAWFGGKPIAAPSRESDEVEALAALRQTLALMAHFYASGGDARFGERMPVTPDLLDEFRADVDYLARNDRRQDSRLQKLEVRSVIPVGDEGLEVRTREFWIHRTLWADGRAESDPPRSVILYPSYRLFKTPAGWRVVGREFERPPEG